MEQPVSSLGRADIAVAVEHDEGVVMLQRESRPGRGLRGRNVEGGFGRRGGYAFCAAVLGDIAYFARACGCNQFSWANDW